MRASDAFSRANALIGAIYRAATDPKDSLALRDHLYPAVQEAPAYTSQQQRFMDHVLGHVQRALALADTAERMKQERRQLERLVDAIAPAICIVRADGTLVADNRAARDLLPDLCGAASVAQRLEVESQAALEVALRSAEREGYSCTLLRRTRRGDALRVHIGRLSPAPDSLLALVVFAEGDLLQRAVVDFVDRYRLTTKERSVLEQALRHPRLEHAAHEEAIRYHTARQHLRSVYDKTGARSQAEILASLMRNVVVREAIRTEDASLLPQARPVPSRTLDLGGPQRSRRLTFAEYGDPNGVPVVYFHTISGSHLELAVHNPRLRRHRIRLIAADRPGYGGSDYLEYEAYATLTHDVRALLDHLRLRRVGLLACSAGIPHALSCAVQLPERVSVVQCAGCIPPIEHVLSTPSPAKRQRAQAYLFRVFPGIMRPALELLLRRQSVESMVRLMLGQTAKLYRIADLDIEFISHPANLDYFVASMIVALRQGTKAWAKEGAMTSLPWGIPFERAECPVHFWHGSADEVFPIEMIESFAAEFPEHSVTNIEGETHLLVHRQLDRILPVFHELR